jgi:hypothetical protein
MSIPLGTASELTMGWDNIPIHVDRVSKRREFYELIP